MTRSTMPLWKRLSFLIAIHVAGIEGNMTGREWLLSGEVAFARTYCDVKCFWPRAWIRILGIYIGIGFIYKFRKNHE